ncbi:kinase-like protein, partial [Clavulina sp. PMI_390]
VQDITLAIKYIHGLAPPIIHGDLHARNILVDQEGRGLLCDFGLSRIKHEPTRSSTSIIEGGRYRYLAPELLSPETESFRTTTASDCYAFSMTILELATLQKPFVEYENEMAAFGAAGRGVRPQRPPQTAFGALNSRATNLLCTLLEEMWNHDAFKRPSMHDVLSSVNEISSHQAYHPSSELAYPYLHPSEYNVLPPASTHTLPLISNGRASISPNLASSHPPSPQATTISATADETTSNNGVIDLDTGQSLLRILDALKGVKSLSLEAQQEVALVQVC